MEGTRAELLAQDKARAEALVASSSGPPRPRDGRLAPTAGRAPAAHARTAPAAPGAPQAPLPPPGEALASRAPAPPLVQVPWAPPAEDEGAESSHGSDVERKFGTADTLGQVLSREGFGTDGPRVVAALAKLVDPKTIRGGQSYLVHLDDEGKPESFEYVSSPVLRFVVERGEDGAWKGRKVEQPVEVKIVDVGSAVESSLYESVQKAGESTTLVSLLVELFAWDVNFYTDTQPGDVWKVIVEKQLLGGKYYRYGRVLAAEYSGRVGTFRAFYWTPPGAKAGAPGRYFDERGQAVSKTMLKTPLRFVRISSKFDRKRFHPILHVEKAHLGIDYAAPTGTPVWASASGRVAEVGMKRGSGNTVVLAHSGGLTTRYYHLSRYARGLHAGQTVKQKDVIGYVGMTGLATGPHLHFSVTKNGAFVDPSKLAVSREAPVADRAAFLEVIRPRLAALKSIQPGAVARK
jgi:murein DD-endopeptidase MepM/ murein hydrolase activator NlpD